jgi:hypothetical protein
MPKVFGQLAELVLFGSSDNICQIRVIVSCGPELACC